jgi:hypothetical protein
VNTLLRPASAVLVVGVAAVLALANPCAAQDLPDSDAHRVLASMPDVLGVRDVPYALAPPCAAPCAPTCAPARCPAPCDNPCWDPCPQYHLSLGLWIWGMNGAVGDDGREFDVDLDFTDTLENLDKIEFAIDIRLRGEWGRWSATVSLDGAEIADEDTVEIRDRGVDYDGEFSIWILQAQVGYGLFGGRLGCSPCAPVGCLEVYGGARAWWVEKKLDVDPGPIVLSAESSDEWIDPIVGLRGELHFGKRWSLLLETDVGGFGVGSDFSWHVLGSVNFHVSRHFSLFAGWKVLDVDYENDDFLWDVTLSGPFAGITISF